MKNIKYIILVVIISHFLTKQNNEEFCENYGKVNDLEECFNKNVESHHLCCGLSISFKGQNYLTSCKDLLASNISIEMYKEHLKEEFNDTFEFICPEFEEEINGTCLEYNSFPVEDGNKCLSLIGETDKTCCSLKYEMNTKIEEFPFPPNYTECISLPNSQSKNDKEKERIKERFNFEGLEIVINCGEVNKSNKINYYSFASLLIFSLLII